ncbi:MAG: hypothetical protein L6R35_006105 [Caloplaca aegaea]|nr:MAG: hypothetical protein L6R35_006105 [Caloplaca aegaea]
MDTDTQGPLTPSPSTPSPTKPRRVCPWANLPKPYVVEPTQAHIHTIIALHGQGSNGPSFAIELLERRRSSCNATLVDHFPECKWVFPSCTNRFSWFFRWYFREWFEMVSTADPTDHEDLQTEGLRESVTYILGIIREEALVIHSRNIVLLGFSQGCATAVHAVLAGGKQLGGFIGLSGWMPFRQQLVQEAEESAEGLCLSDYYARFLRLCDVGRREAETATLTPALLVHHADDDVVNVELGEQMRDALLAISVNVSFEKFATGGHWVPGVDGIDIIVRFLLHEAWS